MACVDLVHEVVWSDKWRYDDAECRYYERQCKERANLGSLATQIAKARQEIQNSLSSVPVKKEMSPESTSPKPKNAHCAFAQDIKSRVSKLEIENQTVKKAVSSLEQVVAALNKRIEELSVDRKPESSSLHSTPSVPVKTQDDDDDDVDLFGSDDEEENQEAARVREERLKAYADKKLKKPGPIAKSSVLLDCKPWDDETDMKEMERLVRTIGMDGLVWGAAKLQPLAFGIMKLSILCIIEDDKVSVDDLSEKITTEFEDFVQSVDVSAFNKV